MLTLYVEDNWVGNRAAFARLVLLESCHGLLHRCWRDFATCISVTVGNKVRKVFEAAEFYYSAEMPDLTFDSDSDEDEIVHDPTENAGRGHADHAADEAAFLLPLWFFLDYRVLIGSVVACQHVCTLSPTDREFASYRYIYIYIC